MLGTRALQIFDDTTCVLRAALRWTEFYQHESCGKCTPCREGAYWLVRAIERLEQGKGTDEDLETILDVGDNIIGRAFCALGDAVPVPITSAVKYFRDEIIQHQKEGGCPFDPAATTRGRIGNSMTVQTTTQTVTVTIDGFEISVPKGTLVIRAAEIIGIRSRGSATTRCSTRSAPAGSAWWTSRASASRSPRAPPSAPTAWWSRRSSPPPSPTRRSRA